MANKSKRIAARQASLSGQRKRKDRKGPSGIPVDQQPLNSKTEVETHAGEEDADTLQTTAGASANQTALPQGASGVGMPGLQRPRRARRTTFTPVQGYVRGEILRIGAITAVIAAILIILATLSGMS